MMYEKRRFRWARWFDEASCQEDFYKVYFWKEVLRHLQCFHGSHCLTVPQDQICFANLGGAYVQDMRGSQEEEKEKIGQLHL